MAARRVLTARDMAAERRRTTALDRTHHLQLIEAHMSAVGYTPSRTIVLGAVPHDRICVTAHANLGFHAAWDFGANGRAVTNPDATQLLYALYPSPVRRWITARGGLKPQMVFLHARGACPYDVRARAIVLARGGRSVSRHSSS